MEFKRENKCAKRKEKTQQKRRRKQGNRLLTTGNKLMVPRKQMGWEWGKQLMGMKDPLAVMSPKVMYGSDQSLYCTPETHVTLYVN